MQRGGAAWPAWPQLLRGLIARAAAALPHCCACRKCLWKGRSGTCWFAPLTLLLLPSLAALLGDDVAPLLPANTRILAALSLPAVYGTLAANRCSALKTKGLLTASTTATQASEALAKLQAYGWEPEAGSQIATLAGFEVAPAVAVTFANALARASVKDNLCGYSFAATTAAGKVTTVDATALAQMYATGNGVPPSSGVQLVNNNALGGPVRDLLSVSPSTGLADMGLDGALCLRNLVTGTAGVAAQLNTGIDETRRNGNLRGILFELMVGYLARRNAVSIDMGIRARAPKTGKTKDIDVQAITAHNSGVTAIECKGKEAGGSLSLAEVEEWLAKIPVFRAHYANHSTLREAEQRFEIWTSGSIDADALARLEREKAQRTKALCNLIRLHVAVIILAGPDELAAPFQRGCNHVVDQAMFIYNFFLFKFCFPFFLINLFKNIFKAAIVFFKDGVFGRKI